MTWLLRFLLLPWRDSDPRPRTIPSRPISPRLRFVRLVIGAATWTPPRRVSAWVSVVPSRHIVEVALLVRGAWYEINLGAAVCDSPTRHQIWAALDQAARAYGLLDGCVMGELDIGPIEFHVPRSRRVDCGGEL